MVHEFSFHIKKGDYCILHTPIKYIYFTYPETIEYIIPENSVLRVDKLNIKSDSTYADDSIEFYFLTKKNKHIVSDKKIPNKIYISIYNLNGVKYSLVNEEDIDKKVSSLIRKHKIDNLLSNE